MLLVAEVKVLVLRYSYMVFPVPFQFVQACVLVKIRVGQVCRSEEYIKFGRHVYVFG